MKRPLLATIGGVSVIGIASVFCWQAVAISNQPRRHFGELPGRASDAARAAIEQKAQTCWNEIQCEPRRECVSPNRPPRSGSNRDPSPHQYDNYVHDLELFAICRDFNLRSKVAESANDVVPRLPPGPENAEAVAIRKANDDIFWAPASKSDNPIERFGDEARVVFGPIPEADCGSSDAKVLKLEVNGNVVDVRSNPQKPGHPLEFEHRDIAGNIVKWTDTISKCDKPSLAGSVTYCGLNSRMKRIVRGNVEWLFLCRKSTANQEVSPDPYWQRNDPRFALFGTIGFNQVSGEIVFFDGRKDKGQFDWSTPFVPPGGQSYLDAKGRSTANQLYDTTFETPCHACHDNKSAYVIDPHMEQARVGYFLGAEDPAARSFSLGNYLPHKRFTEESPFRVIGSAYTSAYKVALSRAQTVRDPTGNCTTCHTLTTQTSGRRLAADSVGLAPSIDHPTWGQYLRLKDERMRFAQTAAHRTEWSGRGGAGMVHPWMVPLDGNDLSAVSPGISAPDWQRLSNCLWSAGDSECGYRPLFTSCPLPEEVDKKPNLTDATAQVISPSSRPSTSDRFLRLTWNYDNSYGGVPERDDVRIDVAIRTVQIPPGAEAPQANDFPPRGEATGEKLVPYDDSIGKSGASILVQNVASVGHTKWSEPQSSLAPRPYKLDLPARCNQRYLIRLLPKRFCFDQSVYTFSPVEHILSADVLCQ